MAAKSAFFRLFLNFLLFVSENPFSAADANPTGCANDLQECKAKYKSYQVRTMMALKEIFSQEQNFSPCPGNETKLKTELLETKARLEQRTADLLAALLAASGKDKESANVPPVSTVKAEPNGSVTLTCESSDGAPLNLCLWEQAMSHDNVQQRQVIIMIDQGGAVHRTGGDASLASQAGFSFTADSQLLKNGKCTLKFITLRASPAGQWSCTLVSKRGAVSTGVIRVQEPDGQLYFATSGDGIKAYSGNTSQVTTVVHHRTDIRGVAFDTRRNKIIYCSPATIYQTSEGNLAEMDVVLNGTHKYGTFWGLGVDWITGNIYAVTHNGFIIACNNAKEIGSFVCVPVLSGLGTVKGIALNPAETMMYWASHGGGSIDKAGMDGSNSVKIVPGLARPCGIVCDLSSRRLFWADENTKKIQSSNMEGNDVRTIFTLTTGPFGLALYEGALYWGHYWQKTVQRGVKTGGTASDIQTIHTASGNIRHLTTVVPVWDLPTGNLTNHCEGHVCPKICVLVPNDAFRCLA